MPKEVPYNALCKIKRVRQDLDPLCTAVDFQWYENIKVGDKVTYLGEPWVVEKIYRTETLRKEK